MIEAYRLCRQSILHYIGAGRLWSSFIHLSHLYWRIILIRNRLFGAEEALRCFRVALHHVAKSGEVWCEGVRIFLDPTSSHFSPSNALKALNYSAFFTPQYGDIIIEVRIMKRVNDRVFDYLWLLRMCFFSFMIAGILWFLHTYYAVTLY